MLRLATKSCVHLKVCSVLSDAYCDIFGFTQEEAARLMEETAKEALRQIEEKAYITELSQQGVKEVWKYGIAFHGKKVWMAQE